MPDDVVERLERLAARDGTSVSSLVVSALGEVARQADNAAVLAGLPDLAIAVDDVIGALDESRAER